MNTEVPFKISVSDEKIALLKAKLDTVTFPDELDDAGWAYGVPLADIKALSRKMAEWFWLEGRGEVDQWAPPVHEGYPKWDGFGCLNIQLRAPEKPDCRFYSPLIRSWMWVLLPITMIRKCWISQPPNFKGQAAFWKCGKILPLLTATSPRSSSFNVVAVSLPGYAFSEGPKKKGFGIAQYARGYCSSTKFYVWFLNYYYLAAIRSETKLMLALGYKRIWYAVNLRLHYLAHSSNSNTRRRLGAFRPYITFHSRIRCPWQVLRWHIR